MWKTLVHNGPYVQPKYERIASPGAPRLLFEGKEFEVPSEVEQYLILYCKYSAPKDDLFVENFFSSLWELFPQVLKATLRGWSSAKVDLSQYREYLAEQAAKTEALSPEAKREKKERALELKEYHSTCILDGVEQTIGGYAVEPASIFKGLGDNPNRGKIKLPVRPEDITINTSVNPKGFPKPPYGKWGAIVADHDKLYVASFRSNVTGKIKYIYLNRNSDFKTNSEIEKYEKARNLALIVGDIREEYHALLKSTDRKERELGLAIYLIDRYAFRVGNEPSTGSGAETTGATTLTRDNVRLLKGNKVAFHFVAKDSIVYDETKKMDEDAYAVLKELMEGAPGSPYGGSSRDGSDFPEKMPKKFCVLSTKEAYCKGDKNGTIPLFIAERLKKKDYIRLFGDDPKATPYGGNPTGGAPVNPPMCSKEEISAAVPPKVLRAFCKETRGFIGRAYCGSGSDSGSDSDSAGSSSSNSELDTDEEDLLRSLEEEPFLPYTEYYKGKELPPRDKSLGCPLKPWGGAPRPNALFSISASMVNKWLEGKMVGLTAKVFRTYNASILIQRELLDKNMSRFNDEKKLSEFTRVNTEIALVCNHKRTVSPEKKEKIEAAIREIDEIEEPTAKQIAKREKLLRDKMTLGVALSTSKMNYIDPRLVYTWCAKNKIDPGKIYSKAMLEATAWAAEEEDFSYLG